jgi:hypothetical protein
MFDNLISPDRISIVVQGPIIQDVTPEVLSSIRKYFRGGEIILSTWKGEIHANLDFDFLIENDDPGALPKYFGKQNNLNRQIASTANGLKAVSRDFAMKVRTDIPFVHGGCLDLFNYVDTKPRLTELQIFKKRIAICSYFTWNPERNLGLFHPSDLFMLGRTEDLLHYWGCPLAKSCDNNVNSPEKYLFVQALNARRIFPLQNIDRVTSNSIWNLWKSEISLLSNFFLFNSNDIGLKNKRHFEQTPSGANCYTAEEWEYLNILYGKNPAPIGRLLNVCLRGFLRKMRRLICRT